MTKRTDTGFAAVLTLILLLLVPAAAHAALSPEVSVRQQHDYTRILFSWPEKVRFKVLPSGNQVVLEFSTDASVDTSRIRAALGSRLTSASSSGNRLTLSFDQPYRVRHFISGNANGIDILGPQKAAATPAPEKPVAEKPAEPKPAAPVARAPQPQLKPQPPVTESATAPAAEKAPEKPAEKPAEQPAEQPKAEPTPPPPAPAEAEPVKPAEAEKPAAPVAEKPATPDPFTPPEAEKKPEAPAAEEAKAEPVNTPAETSATPEKPEAPAAQAATPAEPPVVRESAQVSQDSTPFIVTTNMLPTMTEIRFPWRERVAAAVFARGDAIYIVFDKKKALNMTLLKSIMPASVLQLDEIDVPDHTVLRLETDGNVYAKVVQPERSAQWWVVLSVYRQIPQAPLEIERRGVERDKPNLFIPTLQYADPLRITDPVVGDDIIVAPVFVAGAGVYPPRDYAEVFLPATAQGVAVIPKTDLFELRGSRNGLILDSEYGLSLSRSLPELKLAELDSVAGNSLTWFPWEKWNPAPDSFMQARHKLEQALLNSSGIRAKSLELKVAELYLSEGLASETLSMLRLIEEKDPGFFEQRKLAAHRGAALFLMDRYSEAVSSFNDPSLKGDEELKLWQAALRVFSENRPRFDYLDFFDRYIKYYPPALREKLAIVAADNYINRKNYSRALSTLDTLSVTGLDESRMPYVDYLLGKIAAQKGDIKTARSIWEPLADASNDQYVRARTEFSLVTMLLDGELIDRSEAIDRLDKLRVVWRGDTLEMNLLNYLGALYMQDGQYIEGLRAWRELVEQFPDSPQAPEIAAEMASIFKQLFNSGEADKLSPLDALATFYEFKRLIPLGDEGDEMVQHLADRLAQVDLLHRAAELLEHQITYRQDKLARSKLGSHLALIYLLNEQPEKSLETLEVTNYGENPPELTRRRNRIAAMAYARSGDPQKGIDMLAADSSRESYLVRQNLFWQMREWRNVIRTGEWLMGNRIDVAAPLSQQESEVLLQLAIAYMFERENDQLRYLRDVFGPLMPEGTNKQIFSFVTDSGGPVNPQEFERVSNQIARMEDFMKNWRDQVETGGLSSLLN